MRKPLVVFSSLLFLASIGFSVPALAQKTVPPAPTVHVVGAEANSPDVTDLLAVSQDLMNASNAHNMEGVLKHYSPRFISGDNLTLDQVHQLIEETWKVYPDIQYNSNTLEIRVNSDWATIESIDTAKATAKADDSISETPGVLESRSRGFYF